VNAPEPEARATPPRFSIIITFHNQRDFIKDALDSALAQKNAKFEVIVVDDASTDGSQAILRQYGDAIQLVCLEANQGVGAARNRGASLATGDYLIFHDGDDVFLPWALGVFEKIIQSREPKLIFGAVWWFEGKLPIPQPGDTPREIQILEYEDYLRKDRSFSKSLSKVIDRHTFDEVNGWPTDYQVLEDMDFILRLCACGRTVLILNPLTIFYRQHAVNSLKRRCLPPQIFALYKLIGNERAGKYPGGRRRTFERKALIGGLVLFWAMDAAKAGLYWEAIKFLANGGTMALAAVTQRLGMILRGRQPCEIIKM
jgi:glycosyltransferase involved in cell wall biosynthesis